MLFFDPEKIPAPEPLKNHSASQVKTYEMCERKWTLETLHRLRGPASSAMATGTALHKQIEDWYLRGVEPKAPLAFAGVQNLPVRGSGPILIEKALDKADPTGAIDPETKRVKRVPALFTGAFPWKGFIDLLYQPLGMKQRVQVWDHKTTINLMWAKTNQELKEDLQLNVYAKWCFDSDAALEVVDVFHNYLVTSTMNQTEVRASSISRSENAKHWQHIDARAKEMQVISDMAQQSQDSNFWQRAKPNFDSCGAYGGCPFREMCDKHHNRSIDPNNLYNFTNDLAPAVKNPGEKTMAASDLLKAKIAANASSNGAPAPKVENPPAPAVVTAPAPAPVNAVAAMLAKKAAAAQAALQTAPAGATATGAQGHVLGHSGVLPSDAPAQGVGIPPVSDVMAPPEVLEDLTENASPTGSDASPVGETTEAKAKRGRRTKAQMEADRAASEAEGTKITTVISGTIPAAPLMQAIAAAKTVEAAPVAATRPAGFTLCLGCSPVSGGANPIALEFVIHRLLEEAATQMGIANIHVLDYGKKASLLTELLKKYQFTAPLYTFTTNDAFIEGIVMAVLSQKAALIIRGTK